MKITQLSVFLENKRGGLSEPCKVLAQAGINILTLSLADTEQFGILRLIVRDWNKAKEALEKAGCVVNLTDVIAIEVEDSPGGLGELLERMEKVGINVEYMYAFTFRRDERAVMVFRFEDPDGAVRVLKTEGISMVDSVEFFGRLDDKNT